eukprot:3320479-Amphidinium_carterae.1
MTEYKLTSCGLMDSQLFMSLMKLPDTHRQLSYQIRTVNDVVMMEKLLEMWIKVFGPMRTLISHMISDQEAGIKSENAGIILSRQDRTVTEGTGVSADIMLSEAVHAHNIPTIKGGFTPHEAVFGRTPPALMMDIEEHSLDHIARVCEVAVRSMIESLTEDRIRRAEKSKTHQSAMELELELNPGDLVDFYRQPFGKVNPGWGGPTKVVDVSSLDQDGIAHVRWQGRVMSVQARDIRPHLTVPVWLFRQS